MKIVLSGIIFYVIAGLLLATPYCFLAGWSSEDFLVVAIVAPAFLFIWFMLAAFAGVIDYHEHSIRVNWRAAFSKSKGERWRLPGSITIFWVWTFYSVLPIILHWSAALLEKVGYETAGSLIDLHRYESPLYIFTVILVLLALIMMVTIAWDTIKNVWTRFMQ